MIVIPGQGCTWPLSHANIYTHVQKKGNPFNIINMIVSLYLFNPTKNKKQKTKKTTKQNKTKTNKQTNKKQN